MSDEIERLRKEVADLREWHRRDSAELRRLCEARDQARAERDALRERIEKAPVATQDFRKSVVDQLQAIGYYDGKRVALVVLE